MSELELPVNEYKDKWTEQPMLRPRIASVKINVSIGMAGDPLERAKTIIRQLTDQEPTETLAKNTWRSFGIRKYQPVGVVVTIRGQRAYELLMRLLHAKDYKIKERSIDRTGNFGFGIGEHIDIPGMNYDPNLGIIGMDVIIQMERVGYRVKNRSYKKRKIGKSHFVTPVETKIFLVENYDVELV
ncbi:MAG: 50S ribosomal protein L5 [Candidatus Hodarchaeales archaeon]|jgi:large subunit ribosomal protein L5